METDQRIPVRRARTVEVEVSTTRTLHTDIDFYVPKRLLILIDIFNFMHGFHNLSTLAKYGDEVFESRTC